MIKIENTENKHLYEAFVLSTIKIFDLIFLYKSINATWNGFYVQFLLQQKACFFYCQNNMEYMKVKCRVKYW